MTQLETTQARLRAHMARWRTGPGFNHGPLEEHKEEIRWLCAELDKVKREPEGRVRGGG